MKNPTNDSKTTIDRRSVLKSTAIATGMGIAGVSGFTGAAGAKGHKGGYEPCEDCGGLLAKYEWEEDEDGEYRFIFEKGRDSLGIEGSDFDITVTEWNEDGEPLCIEVDSIEQPETGVPIYDFTCSTVKSGQDIDDETYDWASSFDHCQDTYAISNFALCIEKAFFQVDFGTGPAKSLYTEDPDDVENWYQNGEDDDRTLILSGGNRPDRDNFTGGPYTGSYADVHGDDWTLTLAEHEYDEGEDSEITGSEFNGEDVIAASITFDVLGDEPVELHAFSQELPGPGPSDHTEVPWGPMYHVVEGMYDPDENPHTIDLDLPTV